MATMDSLCISQSSFQSGISAEGLAQDTDRFTSKSARALAKELDIEFKLPYPKDSHSSMSNNSSKSKIKEQKPVQTNPNTSQNSSSKPRFSTPSTEKAWTPLSQSTPALAETQPRDILKAKSKLSQLAQSVHDDADESSTLEEDEAEEMGSDLDDTPSKTKPVSRRADHAPSSVDQVELEELRRLKAFVLQQLNGSLFIQSFESKEGSANEFILQTTKDSNAHKAKITQLKNENDSLREQTQTLTNSLDTISSKSDLIEDELRTLKHENAELNNQCTTLRMENEELSTTITKHKDETIDLQAKLAQVTADLREKEEAGVCLKKETENLNHIIEGLKGNEEESITEEKYPALSIKYRQLELNSVDSLSLVDAHNIIKNILINLNVPYSQIKQRITEMNQILKKDQILYHFVCQIHFLLYQEKLKSNTEKDDKNQLRDCTSQMFEKVELLYNSLSKR